MGSGDQVRVKVIRPNAQALGGYPAARPTRRMNPPRPSRALRRVLGSDPGRIWKWEQRPIGSHLATDPKYVAGELAEFFERSGFTLVACPAYMPTATCSGIGRLIIRIGRGSSLSFEPFGARYERR